MSNDPIIVGYQTNEEAFRKALSALTQESAVLPTPDDKNITLTAPERVGFTRAVTELQAADKTPGVLVAPDHRVAALLQSFLAERCNEIGKLEMLSAVNAKEAKFDEVDFTGWAGSFFTWWRGIVDHAWQEAPPMPENLPHNTIRLAILGDWGTGLYGAPRCADSIRNDQQGYDLVLHVGDVYYSGTSSEVQERFLDPWPWREKAINRALNSNHEMYTGGYAYFDMTLQRFRQQASYFALQNDHWLLVGLDTAYQEHDLAHGQADWLRGLVANAGNRKVILFSHHQPFSQLEKDGPRLQKKLQDLLEAKHIFAWYWGHEHRCVLYDQHPIWQLHGRCVGHSGFPYFRDNIRRYAKEKTSPQDTAWYRVNKKGTVPSGLLLDGPNAYVSKHESEYGPNGYVTLELSAQHLHEVYHAADGTILHEHILA